MSKRDFGHNTFLITRITVTIIILITTKTILEYDMYFLFNRIKNSYVYKKISPYLLGVFAHIQTFMMQMNFYRTECF